MTIKQKMATLLIMVVLLTASGVLFLCSTWHPEQEGLLRTRFLTADDIKEAVKDDKYEQLEGKTNYIKDYILNFLDNLL